MAVDEVVNNVIGNGNGVARTFSFSPVIISKSSDLVVTKVDANGVETELSEGATSTTYSVTVGAYPGTGSIDYPATGGTLLQTGESVSMRSVRELTQSNDLENQGGYFADTQETMFDKLTYIAQQQQEQIDRGIKFAPTDGAALTKVLPGAAARALKTVMFDESGNVTVGTPTAQTLIGVDETDTGTGKTKLVNNALINRFHTVIPSKDVVLSRGSDTIDNGLVYRKAFKMDDTTSWVTLATLTPSVTPSAFVAFFKITAAGHTSTKGDGIKVSEFYVREGGVISEEKTFVAGTQAPGIRIQEAAEVLTVEFQSSDGVNGFRGVVEVELFIPRDFAAGDGTTWTIS